MKAFLLSMRLIGIQFLVIAAGIAALYGLIYVLNLLIE